MSDARRRANGRRDRLATHVTLNRLTALNALDRALSDGLRDALAQVEFDDAVRAVVLQGAGSRFTAGGDLETFHAMLDRAPDDRRRLFERFIFRRGTRIR